MPPSPAQLALTLTPGLGPVLVRRLLERFGSAEAALGAPAAQWAQIRGLSGDRAASLLAAAHALEARRAPQEELERAAALGVRLLALDDPDYPRLLRSIPDPPPILWVQGDLLERDALAVGIVGSRRCTAYGRGQADRFAAGLASAGFTVVSGGAYGIDHAAHAAAHRLRSGGGRTLAVIGSGLDLPYPREHADLFGAIAAEGGAVLSEWPLGTPPAADNFPRRNRIISGLALGIVLIEAAERSGALITARLCVEDHNRELFALPGPVDSPQSAGCHRAIREGWARLTTSVAEVLEALGESGPHLLRAHLDGAAPAAQATASAEAQDEEAAEGSAEKPMEEPAEDAAGADPAPAAPLGLTPRQQQVFAALRADAGGSDLDRLVAATGLPVQQVQSDLTLLELRGLLRRSGGRVVVKQAK